MNNQVKKEHIDITEIIGKACGNLSESISQDKIIDFENVLKGVIANDPSSEVLIPVELMYSGKIIARDIVIPKDTFLTGRIYKDDHFDVMVYGDVTVSTCGTPKRMKGFNVFAGNKGKKRAGYTHSETRWVTFHHAEEMSNKEFLDNLTCDNFSDLEQMQITDDYIDESEIIQSYKYSGEKTDYRSFRCGFLQAKNKPSKLDRDIKDYFLVLKEYGITEEQAAKQTQNLDDYDPSYDEHDYGLRLEKSIIHGLGLYSFKKFKKGDVIMPARVSGKRTAAGRYVNHSFNPNCKMVMRGKDIDLVCILDIDGDEVTTDYRSSLNLQIERLL